MTGRTIHHPLAAPLRVAARSNGLSDKLAHMLDNAADQLNLLERRVAQLENRVPLADFVGERGLRGTARALGKAPSTIQRRLAGRQDWRVYQDGSGNWRSVTED